MLFSSNKGWQRFERMGPCRIRFDCCQEQGVDVAKLFHAAVGNISNFDQQFHVQVPDDIAEMLTT